MFYVTDSTYGTWRITADGTYESWEFGPINDPDFPDEFGDGFQWVPMPIGPYPGPYPEPAD